MFPNGNNLDIMFQLCSPWSAACGLDCFKLMNSTSAVFENYVSVRRQLELFFFSVGFIFMKTCKEINEDVQTSMTPKQSLCSSAAPAVLSFMLMIFKYKYTHISTTVSDYRHLSEFYLIKVFTVV